MTGDAAASVRRALGEAALALQDAAADDVVGPVVAAAGLLAGCLRSGGRVLLFGNGGSAMDAGHIAAELVGRFRRDRPPLPAIALPSATAAMTAIGNDYGYREVFARQVRALGRPGDVAVALSTSGRSANVLAAVTAAGEGGLATVGLTGRAGGELADLVDVCIRAPSEDVARVQEVCMHLAHSICELVETELYPSE